MIARCTNGTLCLIYQPGTHYDRCLALLYSMTSWLKPGPLTAAPERMLWASNWPHPNQTIRLDEAELLDLLLAWVEEEPTRNRILVDNPADLYGFYS